MSSALEKAREYEKRIRFIQHLGVRTVALDDGHARVELDLKPELTNSFGTAHGGVIMTLLDVALCQAARTQHPDAPGIVTIDMATSFIAGGIVLVVLAIAGTWLYYAGFESSSWQATPGKKVLNLAVTDMYGARISFGRASGRFFSELLVKITTGR